MKKGWGTGMNFFLTLPPPQIEIGDDPLPPNLLYSWCCHCILCTLCQLLPFLNIKKLLLFIIIMKADNQG